MNSERYKPPEWLRQQWEEDARGWADLENAVDQARRQKAAKEKHPMKIAAIRNNFTRFRTNSSNSSFSKVRSSSILS